MTTITQRILKNKYFPNSLRLSALLFSVFLMLLLYLESIKLFNFKFTSYWALFVVWTLWWPFLYISVLFFSRIWCGFLCPLGLANEAGEKIRTIKNSGNFTEINPEFSIWIILRKCTMINRIIQKKKTINIAKWGFLAYVLFFIIVLLEQISGLFISEKTTLLFFGIFFITAFALGLFFARWSFCKIICPIGTILSVFSRLSFIGLRTQEEKCRVCKTIECLKGTTAGFCPTYINVPLIQSNKNCLLCARCIKNCPYDSPDIKFVKPGEEVLKEAEFKMEESVFIMALLGFAFILNSKGTEFFRSFFSFLNLQGALLRTGDFVVAIGSTLLFFLIIAIISSKLFKLKLSDGLKKIGYIYLPLTFSIMFFSIVFGFLSPYFETSFNFVAFSKYFILSIGTIWSIYFSYKLTKKYNNILGNALITTSILLISILWLFYLIPGPLNASLTPERHVVLQPNQTLEITAFSMGFDPKIITVKKGQKVDLSIKNIDIVHAFDIDEFGVHLALLNGKTTNYSFVANKTGEFTFYCNVPGHTEAGMKGKLIVEG